MMLDGRQSIRREIAKCLLHIGAKLNTLSDARLAVIIRPSARRALRKLENGLGEQGDFLVRVHPAALAQDLRHV